MGFKLETLIYPFFHKIVIHLCSMMSEYASACIFLVFDILLNRQLNYMPSTKDHVIYVEVIYKVLAIIQTWTNEIEI